MAATEIPTLDDWKAAPPAQRGYLTYMYADWPGSTIPKENPYPFGTENHEQFERGVRQAVLVAQDDDE